MAKKYFKVTYKCGNWSKTFKVRRPKPGFIPPQIDESSKSVFRVTSIGKASDYFPPAK